jgi:hypothetical protein
MRRSRLQGDVINKADRMHSTQLPPPNSGLKQTWASLRSTRAA